MRDRDQDRRYVVLEAPSTLGLRSKGVEQLPAVLLQEGLAERLSARRAGSIEPASSRRALGCVQGAVRLAQALVVEIDFDVVAHHGLHVFLVDEVRAVTATALLHVGRWAVEHALAPFAVDAPVVRTEVRGVEHPRALLVRVFEADPLVHVVRFTTTSSVRP